MTTAPFLRVALAMTCIAVCAVASVGCDSSKSASAESAAPRATPLATAEGFVAALNANDAEALADFFTEKARAGLDAGAGLQIEGQTLERPVYSRATIEGETAKITVTAKRDGAIEDVTLHLRREATEWRIHALGVNVPGQGSMVIDLERIGEFAAELSKQMAEGFQEAFEEAQRAQEARDLRIQRESFGALRALPVDGARASFTTSVPPAATVRGQVDRIAGSIGLPVRWGSAGARANVPVPTIVGVEELPPLAQIDALLAHIHCHGIYPDPAFVETLPAEYTRARPTMPTRMSTQVSGPGAATDVAAERSEIPDDLPAIEIEHGEAPYPVVHAGPFRCAVTEVTQTPEYATGSVTVETRAYALDPAIATATGGMTETLSFTSVTSEAGAELRADPDVHFLSSGGTIRAMGSSITLDLAGLLRDVPRIAAIEGTQRVVIPTDVAECTIDELRAGATGRVGGLTYTVDSVGAGTTISFRGKKSVLEALAVHALPKDATGEVIAVDYQSTSSWMSDSAQFQVQCGETPARLELKCIVASETLEFPFVIEQVPLPAWDDAPVALESLAFDGATPVSVKFQELSKLDTDFPVVKLIVSNHANKDVGTIRCRFEYLDATGTKLEDFPHSLDAPASFDGPKALVAAGKAVAHEATAFFLPEGTKRVAVLLDAVEFLDGSEWSSD